MNTRELPCFRVNAAGAVRKEIANRRSNQSLSYLISACGDFCAHGKLPSEREPDSSVKGRAVQNRDDPELEALRQKRLQQLMAQQGLSPVGSTIDGLNSYPLSYRVKAKA